MYQTIARRTYLTLFGLLFLYGLLATLAHYLMPHPTAEMIASQAPGMEYLVEQMPRFAEYAATTGLHVIPAFFFILLSLMQLSGKIRKRYPAVHRWNGRLFLLLGASIGISGIALALLIPYGGMSERIIITPIGVFFLYALWRGYTHARERKIGQHRRWMFYMVAVGYAPLTMRIIQSILEASSSIPARDMFAWNMLAATIINLIAVNWWLKKKRS